MKDPASYSVYLWVFTILLFARVLGQVVVAWSAPKWLPLPGGTLQHYRNVFVAKDFGPYIVNSVIVDVTATVVALLFAALAAYSIARLRFPGREAIFVAVALIWLIPDRRIENVLPRKQA